MIEKIILNPDEEKKPCIVKWDEEQQDFVVDAPDGLTRADLIELVEEIKRLTEWTE